MFQLILFFFEVYKIQSRTLKKRYISVIKNGTFIATLLLYTRQFSIPTLYIYLYIKQNDNKKKRPKLEALWRPDSSIVHVRTAGVRCLVVTVTSVLRWRPWDHTLSLQPRDLAYLHVVHVNHSTQREYDSVHLSGQIICKSP